ncbi:hypothetical protein V5799_026447 [Amblyomma americanum]|uniref:Tnf receptor-associated factor n=1 Tax=Amblyomma americanum TaxID=6943 RepID=A0AAQ4DIJ6_AMBAM
MLPCLHLLCQSCYDGVGAKSNHCPFHKEPFQEEDVVWSTFSRDSVLGRKVLCWNAEHGCDAEVVASAMLQHFANACQFHVVRCPECSESVRHRDIAKHLECDCESPRAREKSSEDNISNAFMEVKGTLEKILEENAALRTKMDSFEDRLRNETSGAFAAQPTSIADAVTAALENRFLQLRTQAEAVLAEHRREVTSEIRGALAGNERTTKEKNSEECERHVHGLKDRVSSDVLSKSVPYEWNIDDWNGFCRKSSDRLHYFTGNDGQRSYHYGYLVVPRLYFNGVHVWVRVYIIEGLFDKFLKWPMDKKIKCSEMVLHQDIAEHLERDCVPSRARELDDKFANVVIQVKEALGKMQEGNGALRMKLDSFEQCLRPETENAVASQSTIVASAVTNALENMISGLKTLSETALAEHRREVASEIRDALAGREGHERDRTLGDAGSLASAPSAGKQAGSVDDEAKAVEQLIIASLNIGGDFLDK